MALSKEERYGIEKYISWAREYHENKQAETSKLSDSIDFIDGVLDALDSADYALEYCDTTSEYVEELKRMHESEWDSYWALRRTTNRKDAQYYHGSANMLKNLINHAELMFI